MSPQKQHRDSGLESLQLLGRCRKGKPRESMKTNRDKAGDIGWPERTRNRKLSVGRCFPKGRRCGHQCDLHFSLCEGTLQWLGVALDWLLAWDQSQPEGGSIEQGKNPDSRG